MISSQGPEKAVGKGRLASACLALNRAAAA